MRARHPDREGCADHDGVSLFDEVCKNDGVPAREPVKVSREINAFIERVEATSYA